MTILKSCTRQLKIDALYILSLEKEKSYYSDDNPVSIELEKEINSIYLNHHIAGRISIVKRIMRVYLEQEGDRGDFARLLANI